MGLESMDRRKKPEKKKYSYVDGAKAFMAGLAIGAVTPDSHSKWDQLQTSQNIEDRRGRTGGEDISPVETLPPIKEITVSGFDRATIDEAGKHPLEDQQLGSIK